jgi:hypothetical protein
MAQLMEPVRWIDAIDGGYLSDFLPNGGSSVKFAVCTDGVDPADVRESLSRRAMDRGFIVAHLPAESLKVQQIERVFGAISDQMPWETLITGVVAGMAREKGWTVPDCVDPGRGLIDQLDEINDLGRQQISLVLQQECGRKVLMDYGLAKDFRVAMTWMVRARLDAGFSGHATYQQITDWLGGRVAAIGNMRPYQIHTKINRANARHLFGSLCAWVRRAGCPGIVAVLDAKRLTSRERADDGSLNYSIAAVLDAYEILRQFIDATDEFDGFFLVVLAAPEFLDLDARGRGIGRYPALMGRVYDEVRDRRAPNPYSALVRLGNPEEVAS